VCILKRFNYFSGGRKEVGGREERNCEGGIYFISFGFDDLQE
jgi:hypothetical protein